VNALPFIERSNGRRGNDLALALVADLAQALASTLDLDAALNLALARIVHVLGAQGGAVFLVDAATNELVCRACAGPVDIHGLRIPADRGIVGRAFATGQCQIVRDAATDPDFTGAIDRITGVRTQSMLGAPLMTARGPIGVLQVINKRDGALFDESDRDAAAGARRAGGTRASNRGAHRRPARTRAHPPRTAAGAAHAAFACCRGAAAAASRFWRSTIRRGKFPAISTTSSTCPMAASASRSAMSPARDSTPPS
jgi:putative methionine-R-sulfoxide reductase with GAF domain